MAVVRLCSVCERHNGPSFTHCMNCGARLEQEPSDSPADGADKARRLLDSLSEERRALLPEPFLSALNRQANTTHPVAAPVMRQTASGRFKATDTQSDLPLLGPALSSGGFSRLGPRRRDHPADVVTQPDSPVIVDVPPGPDQLANEWDVSAGGLDDRFDDEPVEDYDSWDDPPPVHSSADDMSAPPWPGEAAEAWPAAQAQVQDDGDAPLAFGADLRDVHSYEDLQAVSSDALPFPEPTVTSRPVTESPLAEALSNGIGPFGDRAALCRLVMLPDKGYRARVHFLQHRLSQTLQIDLFTARQFLQRAVPTCLASGEDRLELESMTEHLKAGGVTAVIVDRDSWLQDTTPVEAIEATGPAPGPVDFNLTDGSAVRIYRADIAWAAVGRIEPEPGSALTTTEPDASLSMEMGAGRPYDVLYLLRYGSRRPLRIRADHFDFECLGADKGFAAAVNLRDLLGWLAAGPDQPVRFDDCFKRVTRMHGNAARGDVSDEAAAIPTAELEFSEYVLLLDTHGRAL